MSVKGVREEPVAEFKSDGLCATLYRLSPRRHRLDTFDVRNPRGTYLSVTIGSEATARQAFRTEVDRIMDRR
jgi:hypothetical protein